MKKRIFLLLLCLALLLTGCAASRRTPKQTFRIYGLSGAVFGADEYRALAIARRIRTGTMSINGGVWYGADVPFGGVKQSGIGREMGVAGFEEYLDTTAFARPVG